MTNQEAVDACRDSIITHSYTGVQWAFLVMEEDELDNILPGDFNYNTDEFNAMLDELEIELFGEVVCK